MREHAPSIVVVCLAIAWAPSAAANHDGLAEGIALMLALVGASVLVALTAFIATIAYIVQARRAPNERAALWCRRFAFIDGILAATSAVLFVATGASGDSTKLLIPLIVFAVAAVIAWRTAVGVAA